MVSDMVKELNDEDEVEQGGLVYLSNWLSISGDREVSAAPLWLVDSILAGV